VRQELLDWLAELVRTAGMWRQQRLIVTRPGYRQSSRVTPEMHEKDPRMSAGARVLDFGFPAETVRDNALAASVLLNAKIGGARYIRISRRAFGRGWGSEIVYSAAKLHPQMARTYTGQQYTFWKRTVRRPPRRPSMRNDRETCRAVGFYQHALPGAGMLNDQTYVGSRPISGQRA